MDIGEGEKAKPHPGHEIGQDLSLLSADELKARIALLRQEAERLEAELAAKDASKTAAEQFFRR